MTFKVNDRVKIINTIYKGPELAVGQTGVIMEIDNYIEVKMDNGFIDCDDDPHWVFCASELQLIQEK